MTAIDSLLQNAKQDDLSLVTSRESMREIERTPVEATKRDLESTYATFEVVEDDHVVLGSSLYTDKWTSISMPFVSDVVDKAVFEKIGKIGITGSDQRHLMYAIHNKCDVFLTSDRKDFIKGTRRRDIEDTFPQIKVRTPVELLTEIAHE